MTKRRIARVIASVVSIVIAASSLGVASPAKAATYDGVSGTIDCSISGTVTIANNVVTTHSNCSGSVEIPAGVTRIEDSAFEYAPSLQAVTFQFGSQLARIGQYSFSFAESLINIDIPASVTNIDDYAFDNATSLVRVYFLGNAPTSISSDAFSFVANGAKAIIKPGATGFANEGQTWKGLIVEQERFTITYNSASGSAVDSGSFTSGGSIQTAPTSTRPGYSLLGWSTSATGSVIEFPYSPTATSDITLHAIWQLSNGEFKCTTGLPLEGGDTSPTYTITNGVVSAGSDCAGDIVISAGVASIGNWAFNGAIQLQSVTFASPVELTSIGIGAFAWTSSLTSISIPASVTNIGETPFYASALSNVTVDSENPIYSSIEGVLFNKLGTTLIYYPGKKSGTTYSIPSNVTSIQDYAFAYAKVLSSVTIPSSVTSIPAYAFENATSLTSISIPSSVTSIGERAFYFATSLTSISIPSSVTSIGVGAFSNADSLTTVTIPTSVTSIGDFSFYGADSLTSVTIPTSVTSIGVHAFTGAISLSSITIPDSVTSIGNFAFSSMTSMNSITIPESVTSIGTGVFYYANSLSNINVDTNNQNYRSLGGVLFNKSATTLICYPTGKSETSYDVPSTVMTIGNSAFANARSLTSVGIPAAVTNMEAYAFQNASSLTSITLPAGLVTLDFYTFNGATSLSSVYFLGDAPLGSTDAFVNVASGAKAYIKSGATGFASEGETWNRLIVEDDANTVTYNSTNGSAVTSGSFTTGGSIQTAPTSTRPGYTLTGWSRTENGTVVTFPYKPGVVADITLYASWSVNTNSVSYNAGSGSAVTSGSFVTGGKIQTSPTSTRAGYTLSGWATSATGSVIEFPYTPNATSDITLYAIWSANTNTVTYNAASGSIVTAGSFTTGGTIQSAPTSSRLGYTLTGWSTSANGSVIEFPYTPTATSDITLYAIWQLNGEFHCTTGLPLVGQISSRTYTITRGVVSAGSDCVGAVVIPSGVTAITDSAFLNAAELTSISVDEANLHYASSNGVLFNKSLTTLVKYPAGKSGTFYVIPNSVTSIGNCAFKDTNSLISITIPASVISIGDSALAGSIKSVRFLGGAPANISVTAFSNLVSSAKAYLPTVFASFNLDQYNKWQGLNVVLPLALGATDGYVNCMQGSQVSGVILVVNKTVSKEVGCSGEVTIPTGVTSIGASAFADASELVSVSIPASTTSIGSRAFNGATSLVNIYCLGKAPTQVGAGAFADINAAASVYKKSSVRFVLINRKWNGLPVTNGYVAKFSGNGNNYGLVPSEIMRGAGQTLIASDNSGGLAKIGYTFAGWNTSASGRGTAYTPGAIAEMPQRDITMYAMWTRNPVKATNMLKPAISGFAISTLKGRNILSATSGAWMGYPNPSVSYQWYSCTQQIATKVSVTPESCSIIEGATLPNLALTEKFKGLFIAVEVSGESAGTIPTRSFSMSTARVK